HLLGYLLALLPYALLDRPPPDFVPRRRPLRPWAHRERRQADLADDLGALGIIERAEMGRVDEGESGLARHEDGVGLIAPICGHAGRTDFVGVDRVPPELDDLPMAGLGHRRLELGGRELIVVALEQRPEDVAIVGPHGPPQAAPGVVHAHAADKAPFDLACLLQPLANLT